MIDGHRPDHSDTDILTALAALGNRDQIIRGTFGLAGRWALLIIADDQRTFITDGFGLRQVVYTVGLKNGNWYASDAKLIADLLHLEPDALAQQFLNLIKLDMGMREYYFPADVTLYSEIKHLPPNHYLDLSNQSCHRFFPCDPRPEQSTEVAADRAATMLKNVVEGAQRRFPLSLGLTAGMDSRLVLAATKAISQDVFYYTVAHPIRMKDPKSPESDPDVNIAKKLCERLGLRHHLIWSEISIEGTDFERLLQRQTSLPHLFFGEWAYALLGTYPEQRVALTGSCSEAARLKWYRKASLPTISADKISDLYGWQLSRNEFVLQSIEKWLQTAKPSCEKSGFEILDLFYWEFKMGRWLSQNLTELDLVQEVMCPFNCRELITTMMSTPWNDRSFYTHFRLQRIMLSKLWQECLSLPWKTDTGVKKSKNYIKAHLRTKIFGKGYPASFLQTLQRSWSI
jgi:hypothetical protein